MSDDPNDLEVIPPRVVRAKAVLVRRIVDPLELVVPPQLDKGHSEKIGLYIQGGHARAAGRLVQARAPQGWPLFPWDNPQDFYRWAIKHGLDTINDLYPNLITSHLSQAALIIENAKQDFINARFIDTINRSYDGVMQAYNQGRMEIAYRQVRRTEELIEAMPEDTEFDLLWKAEYRTEFKRRFGILLDEMGRRGM